MEPSLDIINSLVGYVSGNVDQVDPDAVAALDQINEGDPLDKYIADVKRERKALEPVTVNYSCYSLSNTTYMLRNICDAFIASKFTPNKFPTAVSRIDDCTLLSYPKRRTKVVGIKCVEKVRFYLHAFRLLLGSTSVRLHDRLKFGDIKVMNIVAMASIDRKFIHNDNMARIFTYNTIYVPELFPCLILYHPLCTFNIFDTGKITMSGLKSNDDKRRALQVVFYHLWRSMPTDELKDEFKALYITNPNPPDVTDVPKQQCNRWLEEEEDKEDLRFLTNDPSNSGNRRLFSTSLVKQSKSKFNNRINKRHATINKNDGTLFTCIHNLFIAKHDQQLRYRAKRHLLK